jgi:pentatricopeptide repeat protein
LLLLIRLPYIRVMCIYFGLSYILMHSFGLPYSCLLLALCRAGDGRRALDIFEQIQKSYAENQRNAERERQVTIDVLIYCPLDGSRGSLNSLILAGLATRIYILLCNNAIKCNVI